jgi:hypothetical protein
MKLKTKKAWATYSDDGKARVYETHLYTHKDVEFLAGFAKVENVRIVPEASYRRMMAAVKVAEQACETGQNMMSHELWHLACKYYETRQKAKGKVKRG